MDAAEVNHWRQPYGCDVRCDTSTDSDHPLYFPCILNEYDSWMVVSFGREMMYQSWGSERLGMAMSWRYYQRFGKWNLLFCCNITGRREGQDLRLVVFNHRHRPSHCCCKCCACWSCCGEGVDSGVVNSGTILNCPSLSLFGKSFFFASNQDMNAVIQIVEAIARRATTHPNVDAE